MQKIGNLFIIFITALAYILTYLQVWVGVCEINMGAYICVFLVLLFLSYMFLHGAYYIAHTGKKTEAEILSVNSMETNDFYACFKVHADKLNAKRICIAKYQTNTGIQRELVPVSKVLELVPGKRTNIYVITHKMGVKTEYEVRTSGDIIRNIVMGVPFAVELIGWVYLFVMRGI